MKNNFDAIHILIRGSQTSVEPTTDNDGDLHEPFVASELGRKK